MLTMHDRKKINTVPIEGRSKSGFLQVEDESKATVGTTGIESATP
jgi:hypothetical protein